MSDVGGKLHAENVKFGHSYVSYKLNQCLLGEGYGSTTDQ